MKFAKDYPELSQFFGAYFPDADLEGLSDEQVVASYVAECKASKNSKSHLEKVKNERMRLTDDVHSYWQEIDSEANRYFETPDDALKWLAMIKHELNKLI